MVDIVPMSAEELAALDRLVHEPAWLAIMTALSAVKAGDFTLLLNLTGLTNGSLSSLLLKLEEGECWSLRSASSARCPTPRSASPRPATEPSTNTGSSSTRCGDWRPAGKVSRTQ